MRFERTCQELTLKSAYLLGIYPVFTQVISRKLSSPVLAGKRSNGELLRRLVRLHLLGSGYDGHVNGDVYLKFGTSGQTLAGDEGRKVPNTFFSKRRR